MFMHSSATSSSLTRVHARCAPTVLRLFATVLFFTLLTSLPLCALDAADYAKVTVPEVKTSIYVGSVKLTLTPFSRGSDNAYTADYKATVVPFFFFNESGNMRIPISDEQLAQLERGERMTFSGSGENSSREARRVEGHATPDSPGAKTGKIKVRVFVTKKIELIFNTTYEFARS